MRACAAAMAYSAPSARARCPALSRSNAAIMPCVCLCVCVRVRVRVRVRGFVSVIACVRVRADAFLREGSLSSLKDASLLCEAMPAQLQSLVEAALVLNDPILDAALMRRLFEALASCAENEQMPKDDPVLSALTPIIECAALLPDLLDAPPPQHVALWKDACSARTRSTLTRFFAQLLAGVIIDDLVRHDEEKPAVWGEAEPLPRELAEQCEQSALAARVCIAYMGERASVGDWVRVRQMVDLLGGCANLVGAAQPAQLHAALGRMLRFGSVPGDVLAAVSALLASSVGHMASSPSSLACGLHMLRSYAPLAPADADELIGRALDLSHASTPADRTAAVHRPLPVSD